MHKTHTEILVVTLTVTGTMKLHIPVTYTRIYPICKIGVIPLPPTKQAG